MTLLTPALKKIVARSCEIINPEGQSSILFNSRRIVPHSEPFEQIIPKEIVSRSTEVTKGQKSQSKSKKVKF